MEFHEWGGFYRKRRGVRMEIEVGDADLMDEWIGGY